MSYLFPVDPVSRAKTEGEKTAAVEKIADYEKNSKQNQHEQQDEGFSQLEEKIKKLINDKKMLEAIDLSGLNNPAKSKLLRIVKEVAVSFLKKELLKVAKSILSISVDENPHDEIDDDDLSFSDYLARLVMKLSSTKKPSSQNAVTQKVGKANPLEDKNAGFLVHYCKNILSQKTRQNKNTHKLGKLNKKELDKTHQK